MTEISELENRIRTIEKSFMNSDDYNTLAEAINENDKARINACNALDKARVNDYNTLVGMINNNAKGAEKDFNTLLNLIETNKDIITQIKNSKQKEEKKIKKIRKMRLTQIQKEILKLYKEGYKQTEIAESVSSSLSKSCSSSNVRTHLQRMRDMGYEVDVI